MLGDAAKAKWVQSCFDNDCFLFCFSLAREDQPISSPDAQSGLHKGTTMPESDDLNDKNTILSLHDLSILHVTLAQDYIQAASHFHIYLMFLQILDSFPSLRTCVHCGHTLTSQFDDVITTQPTKMFSGANFCLCKLIEKYLRMKQTTPANNSCFFLCNV